MNTYPKPLTPSVTVITPTIRGREQLLAEAQQSVRNQTYPCTHLIGLDIHKQGPSHTRNQLASHVTTDLIAFLDDDDLLHPHHVETLVQANADLAYSFCEVEGRPGFNPNHDWDADLLQQQNFIPVTTLICTHLFHQLGGFNTADEPCEDWGLWKRVNAADAIIHCEPTITWTYRFQPDGVTHNHLIQFLTGHTPPT